MSNSNLQAATIDPIRLLIEDRLHDENLLSVMDAEAQINAVRQYLQAAIEIFFEAIDAAGQEALLDELHRVEDHQEMLRQCFTMPSAN